MPLARFPMPGPPLPATRTAACAALLVLLAMPAAGQGTVERVTLYQHGVAAIERLVPVEGDTSFRLTVPEAGMADFLKTLVVRDLGGGSIAFGAYPGKTPAARLIEKMFGGRRPNGLRAILEAFRGARVTLEVGSRRIDGRILGVETTILRGEDGTQIPRYRASILETGGTILSIALEDIASLRLEDDTLQQDLSRYLDLESLGLREDDRTITIEARGQGQRQIHVAYVLENPAWKVSHRLVFPAGNPGSPSAGASKPASKGAPESPSPATTPSDAGGEARLQTWAIADNATEEGWNDVRLALVSTNAISFQYDLYSPLFRHRPVVEIPGGTPAPPRIAGEVLEDAAAPARESPPRMAAKSMAARAGGKEEGAGGYFGPSDTIPPAGNPLHDASTRSAVSTVAAVAAARSLTEGVRYDVTERVRVPAHGSAMIPIHDGLVEASPALYWVAGESERNPWRVLELHNTTGLRIEGGPVTVFEKDSYAGEGLLAGVEPGEERLLAFAVEGAVTAESKGDSRRENVHEAVASGGLLSLRSWEIWTDRFTFWNHGKEDRSLLLDDPLPQGWEIVTQVEGMKDIEGGKRIPVALPAGRKTVVPVSRRILRSQSYQIQNLQPDVIEGFVQRRMVPPEQVEAFHELSALIVRLRALEREIQNLQARDGEIRSDHARYTEGLRSLKGTPEEQELRKKFLARLDALLDETDRLRERKQAARDEMESLRAKLQKKAQGLVFAYDVTR